MGGWNKAVANGRDDGRNRGLWINMPVTGDGFKIMKASFKAAAGKDRGGRRMLGWEPDNEGLFSLFSLEMGLNS